MQVQPTTNVTDQLVAEVQFEIPEANYATCTANVKQSIIDFLHYSHYWHIEVSAGTVLTGVDNYSFTEPAGVANVSLIQLVVTDTDGEEYEFARDSSLGDSKSFWQVSPTEIVIADCENWLGATMKVVLAVKPLIDANPFNYCARILIDYRKAIVSGAKSLIYRMPQKKWTDLKQAEMHDGIHTGLREEALRRQARGYTQKSERVPKKRRLHY
jgi:hypothetical protein